MPHTSHPGKITSRDLPTKLGLHGGLQFLACWYSDHTATSSSRLKLSLDFLDCIIEFPSGVIRETKGRLLETFHAGSAWDVWLVALLQGSNKISLCRAGEEDDGHDVSNNAVEIHAPPNLDGRTERQEDERHHDKGHG